MPKKLIVPLLLVACQATEADPADTAAPTTDPGTPPVCEEVVSGRWTASGSGFGMAMDTTLTFDVAKCEIVASDWEMNHPSQMWGGTVDGDQVTLYGSDDYWLSCTGTLEPGGAAIAGVCTDHEADGSFTLTLID